MVTNAGFEQNWTQDLAVQSDGKLVVAGFALDSSQDQGMLQLTRYTADGVLDSAFHGQGDVVINDGADYFITAVTMQSDGKIVVTGSRDGNFLVARFLTDGTRDISFGCTGMTGTDFGGDNDTAYNAFVQSDGRIVAVGFGDPLVDPGLPSEQYAQGFALRTLRRQRRAGRVRLHARRLRRHPRLPRHVDRWRHRRSTAVTSVGTSRAVSRSRRAATAYMLDGWGALHPIQIRGDGFPSGPAFNATVTGLGYWQGWDIARDVVVDARRHRRVRPRRLGRPASLRTRQRHRTAGGRAPGIGTAGTSPRPRAAARRHRWLRARRLGRAAPVRDRQPPDAARGVRRLLERLGHRRGVSIMPDGTGGYVLDGFGGLHPFAIGNHPLPPATSAGYWNGWDIARGTALVP